MRFVIAGGSGQIGQVLARSLTAEGHEVSVLARGGSVPVGRQVPWDGVSPGPWFDVVDGADVLINLAGRTVNCRYTERNLQEMMDSRVRSTRVLGKAVAQSKSPPALWLQMSTATIYADTYEAANDEASGEIGGSEPNVPAYWKRSIEIATQWERAVSESSTPSTRKVLIRSAMMMSPDAGGVFDVLLRLVRFGLGGKAGTGRQFVSWIHDVDFVAAVRHLIQSESLEGAVNLCSPSPLPNDAFMQELRRAWGRRIGLPASKWMLEFGAFFLRTDTELILKSRKVIPGRLLESGFTFQFPEWQEAARDLTTRWRGMQERKSTFNLGP